MHECVSDHNMCGLNSYFLFNPKKYHKKKDVGLEVTIHSISCSSLPLNTSFIFVY